MVLSGVVVRNLDAEPIFSLVIVVESHQFSVILVVEDHVFLVVHRACC